MESSRAEAVMRFDGYCFSVRYPQLRRYEGLADACLLVVPRTSKTDLDLFIYLCCLRVCWLSSEGDPVILGRELYQYTRSPHSSSHT